MKVIPSHSRGEGITEDEVGKGNKIAAYFSRNKTPVLHRGQYILTLIQRSLQFSPVALRGLRKSPEEMGENDCKITSAGEGMGVCHS